MTVHPQAPFRDVVPPTGGSANAHVRLRQVVAGERIDQIAAEEYGDPSYWTVIAQFNDLYDPARLAAAQMLKLPSRSLLERQS